MYLFLPKMDDRAVQIGCGANLDRDIVKALGLAKAELLVGPQSG